MPNLRFALFVKQQATAPPWTAFLTKWCSYLAKWATNTHRFIGDDDLTLFMHTLEVYIEKHYIPPVTLSSAPPCTSPHGGAITLHKPTLA